LPALVLVAGCTTPPRGSGAGGDWPVGNADTMWEPRYLVGSYRNWGEIFPVRKVKAAPDGERLPRGTPVGDVAYRYDGQRRTLGDYIEDARMTGLLVIRDGEIRLERYAHGADASSRLTGMSMSKSVVSTLVGIALAEGRIDSLSDPIDRYVPALSETGYAGVPIEAALQMSSGIDFDETYNTPGSDTARMWEAVVVERTVSAHDYLLRMESRRPPFEAFNYNPVDTQVLAWVLESATGEDLSTYLSARIWQPAGMLGDATWGLDRDSPSGNEIAYCCLNARLRDWARFGLLLAQEGRIGGERVLPADWIRRATEPSRAHLQPGQLYEDYPLGYQYQWWTFPEPSPAFTALGINGQFLYVDPDADLVVASTAAWREAWEPELEREFHALVERLRELTEPS
jgi:CubicO group peptidase (beta-lactamase class C family)